MYLVVISLYSIYSQPFTYVFLFSRSDTFIWYQTSSDFLFISPSFYKYIFPSRIIPPLSPFSSSSHLPSLARVRETAAPQPSSSFSAVAGASISLTRPKKLFSSFFTAVMWWSRSRM